MQMTWILNAVVMPTRERHAAAVFGWTRRAASYTIFVTESNQTANASQANGATSLDPQPSWIQEYWNTSAFFTASHCVVWLTRLDLVLFSWLQWLSRLHKECTVKASKCDLHGIDRTWLNPLNRWARQKICLAFALLSLHVLSLSLSFPRPWLSNEHDCMTCMLHTSVWKWSQCTGEHCGMPKCSTPIARGRLPWQTWQAKQVSEHSNYIELVCHAMRCMICMH